MFENSPYTSANPFHVSTSPKLERRDTITIMKNIIASAFLLAGFACAVPLLEQQDEGCSMEWVTVYEVAPTGSASSSAAINTGVMGAKEKLAHSPTSTAGANIEPSKTGSSAVDATAGSNIASSSIAAASASASDAAPAATNGNATDTASVHLPNLLNGSPAFPINGDHLKAPVATDTVPAGAATYTPKAAGVFDCLDFQTWLKNMMASNPPTKWIVIKPGVYTYALGAKMPAGTDPNTVDGENIVIGMNTNDWTLDFRGVTFYIDITPGNQQQRPQSMIYTNQVNDVTILGGTIWVDQGEQWSQARVTDLSAADSNGNQVATVVVDQGYNVSAWRSAGPRNQKCIDDSNKDSFSRPGCNFWYFSNYNFDNLDSKRTWTASVGARAGLKQGYVLSMQVGPSTPWAISSENNNGLHVRGLTTNAALISIGNQNQPNKKIVTFEDVYMVNPPNRPGYAPRVNGPALSWGNIGGMVYDAPGQPLSDKPGSFWQTTAAPKDLQAASNTTFA